MLDPETLDKTQSRDYSNIVAGLIKTQVKPAARQLEATALRHTTPPTRVLVIISLGYTALRALRAGTQSVEFLPTPVCRSCF